MFTDRHGNPTDDADRDYTGTMAEFAPGDDYDPMYSSDERGPRCATGEGFPCCCDQNTGAFIGPGCRECNPPDHECKPYGFGIETFDSPEWAEARRHFAAMRTLVFGLPADAHPIMDYGHWLRAWAIDAGWSETRSECSERLWDRLCDTCETHTEAKAKYEAWARRAAAK